MPLSGWVTIFETRSSEDLEGQFGFGRGYFDEIAQKMTKGQLLTKWQGFLSVDGLDIR